MFNSMYRLGIAFIFITSICYGGVEEDLSAAGWVQYGIIGNSTDTTGQKNLNGRALINSGAQLLIDKNLTSNLNIHVGVGILAGHYLATDPSNNGGYSPMNSFPYIAEANFKYNVFANESDGLFVRGGFFPFHYSENNRNLGLYLLRGPVYPGYVLSGFETKEVLPVANMLGFQVSHSIGVFSHSLLINSEIEFHPYFDFSPAYLANLNFGGAFEVGAGVNFYHLISVEDSLTNYPQNSYDQIYIDSITGDTTLLPFSGIKLGANFSIDIKKIMGLENVFGEKDLIFYGEIALLGIKNSKVYKELYGSYSERMPMMFGINIPAFNFLDHLSFEMEWYKARFRDNLDGYRTTRAIWPSAKPYDDGFSWENKDNLKWSLHTEKVVMNHVKISMQVANDHFRPGIFKGYGDDTPPGKSSIMISPKDWYWMMKLAYFF